MTGRPPPLDTLVARDDPDRDRLEAAHHLLVAAGAPPELPPGLASPPSMPRAGAIALPRRRNTAIAVVVIAATMLFGLGYAVGGRDRPQPPVRAITMTGPSGATASIALRAKDPAGNWPMTLDAKGLPSLPKGRTYALWLTRNGRLAERCGEFVAGPASIEVPLNAPYRLENYDGWVVVRTGSTGPFVLRTPKV